MALRLLRAGARRFAPRACVLTLAGGLLVACGAPHTGTGPKGVLSALDALAFKYERFFFGPRSRARGTVARKLRRDTVAFPVEGALTRMHKNPMPAELMMHVRSLSTTGGRVVGTGDLVLRDLRFGGELARLDGYSFSGLMPRVSGGAEIGPAIFRLIEADALSWLGGLECSTIQRICAEEGTLEPEPEQSDTEEAADDAQASDEDAVSEDGTVDLAKLAPRRRNPSAPVNAGGIRPADVLAAAPKPKPAPEAAPSTPQAAVVVPIPLGSTVASLGLLDRSGNWLRTPLVSEETPGRIRNSATGAELDVLLIPKDGAPGSGSQISLAALSELGANLTDLLTLIVYKTQ